MRMLGVHMLREERRWPRRNNRQQTPTERGAMRRAVVGAAHCLSRVRDCAGIAGPLTWPTISVGEVSTPENVTVRVPRFIENETDVTEVVPESEAMSR